MGNLYVDLRLSHTTGSNFPEGSKAKIPLLYSPPTKKKKAMEKQVFFPNLGRDFSVRVHGGLEAVPAAGADFPSIKLIPWPLSFVREMSGGGKKHKCGFPSEKWRIEGGFLNLSGNGGGEGRKTR